MSPLTRVTAPRVDVDRFEFAAWGEEYVAYDKAEFLTHLLPAEASRVLSTLLLARPEPETADLGKDVEASNEEALELLRSIGILRPQE